MSVYSTGEIARLCGVSVRTVQFYDGKGILHPSEVSEGGRRLYSEADVKKLRFICMLKALGLSLDSIKEILQSEQKNEILLLLLEQQERRICEEMQQRENQMASIRFLRETLKKEGEIPAQSLCDVEEMMKGKKELRRTHSIMLAVGIAMDLIQLALFNVYRMREKRLLRRTLCAVKMNLRGIAVFAMPLRFLNVFSLCCQIQNACE